MERFLVVLCVFCTFVFVESASLPSQNDWGYLRLQPELDNVDVSTYLKNDRLVKIQLKCLLLDGPCDIVGRWLKPRVRAALLGECLVCTEVQQKNYEKWLQSMIERFPDFYRAAISKYIQNSGIAISPEEQALVDRTLTDEAIERAFPDFKSEADLKTPKASTTDSKSKDTEGLKLKA